MLSAANWAQPGWCSLDNPKACVTDCSIPGKCDPALPVCLRGEVPSFFHAVVWQQRDEDWAHYYWPWFSSQVEEVSVLWDTGMKQKGCSSTGVGWKESSVKHVSSTSLLTAYWLPCAIPGNLEVGVHIADVSYFVLEETALDKVASERATSVYLVQKVRTAFPLSVWWLCLPLTIN